MTTQYETSPSFVTKALDPKEGIMIAFNLFGADLNDPNSTYLDIRLRQQFFLPGFQLINETSIPLVACT